MSESLRVLAIHAHPDDLEFLCAGTLARLAHMGHRVLMATMTAGDCGSDHLEPEEIATVRKLEARAAAALIGAEYHCLGFRDLSIVFDNSSRRIVTEHVRTARPDLVLTAAPVDYMPDHEITSRLVRDACFNASVPNYRTRQWDPAPPLSRIPHLYYVDPIGGIDHFGQPIEPDFVVDVSDTFGLRLEMLACHASQREWLQRQHEMDEYLDACRRWAARRGAEIGAAYAEGFRQHTGHPFPQDNRLSALLEVQPENS